VEAVQESPHPNFSKFKLDGQNFAKEKFSFTKIGKSLLLLS
jgi:hypothetical protein